MSSRPDSLKDFVWIDGKVLVTPGKRPLFRRNLPDSALWFNISFICALSCALQQATTLQPSHA